MSNVSDPPDALHGPAAPHAPRAPDAPGAQHSPDPVLELRVEPCGAFTVVRVRGEIDLATRDQLRACLATLHGDVVVDLSAVTFLDSSGMATLLAQATRLDGESATLRLRRPAGLVARVLHISGLDDLLES
jgi:anti-anti-sigma factor